MDNNSNAWYSLDGSENDVIISTRIRLARNLLNYPFPSRFSHDDGMRVQALVFDAFSKIEHAEHYQALSVKKMDSIGQKILLERGALCAEHIQSPVSGIVLRTDGSLICNVNVDDHLQIAAFCSGFDADYVYNTVKSVDSELQNILQIAASIDFGYLTCKLENVGTGIKISVFAHLPSLALLDTAENGLGTLFSSIETQGYSVTPAFGLFIHENDTFTSALGNCYQISTTAYSNGSEIDQINSFCSVVKQVIDSERLQRIKICDTKPTVLRDSVYKALVTAKYARLLSERECLELLFRIKWGKDAEILSGVDDFQLSSLLYRIREGHISFISQAERFKFAKDVNTYELQIKRLRALIMQEAVENIQILS